MTIEILCSFLLLLGSPYDLFEQHHFKNIIHYFLWKVGIAAVAIITLQGHNLCAASFKGAIIQKDVRKYIAVTTNVSIVIDDKKTCQIEYL